jgi:hypothetical protein
MSNVAAKEVEAALRNTLGSFGLDHVKLEEGLIMMAKLRYRHRGADAAHASDSWGDFGICQCGGC